jgi:four helix bundle protein
VLVTSHRNLLVGQKAVDLAPACYRMAKQLPRLMDWYPEIERAAVSIPAHIAEAHGRGV